MGECEVALESIQDNVQGSDGIKAELIRKLSAYTLQVLFNVFLAAEYRPITVR